MKLIVYIGVFAASWFARSSLGEKFDDVQAAVFSRGAYPNPGDLPVLNRKVFRATRVRATEHPYVVSVRRLHAHYLTGAILSPHVVATVAHPIYTVPPTDLGVVGGESYCDRGSALMSVILVVVHEDFDPRTLRADLGLLRLFETMFLKNTQKPIAIFTHFLSQRTNSSSKKNLKSKKAFVTGWGRCDWIGNELCLPRSSVYFHDEIQDPMLRTISFDHDGLIENPYCVGYEKNMVRLERGAGMLCVGTAREAEQLAPCLAAPGATLAVEGALAGLLSWGFGCGYINDLPLVYTDVQYFRKWIAYNKGILEALDTFQLSELYIAAKSYIIQSWLVQTSDQKPRSLPRRLPPLRITDLDRTLITLQGNVTDLRDYAFEGKYKEAKQFLYESLRKDNDYKQRIIKISQGLRTEPARPFLNTQLLRFPDYTAETNNTLVNDKMEVDMIIKNESVFTALSGF